MRILFDPQVFNLGYSGMYRYYSSLFKGLKEAGIEIVYPDESFLAREPGSQTFIQSLYPQKVQRLMNRFEFQRIRKGYFNAISRNDFDLLYITAPNFETDFSDHLKGKPFVMTVHDTMKAITGYHTFFDQPRNTSAIGYLAHKASRVVCVSSHTKNDLCTKYQVDENKAETVYLANFLSGDDEMIDHLPESYILFVGARNGRKNFFDWIKPVAPYLSQKPDLHVAVTGPITDVERFFLRKFGIEQNLVSFKNVTDGQLKTLYKNAICLVYPSLYEGFGLPVLEAMANGCPVIASNNSSIPEVAGSAAMLIDPFDPAMMLDSLKQVVENPGIRKDLIQKGLEQSKKFTKEKFINGMIDNFEKAIRDFSG